MPKATEYSESARVWGLDRPLNEHEHPDTQLDPHGDPLFYQSNDAPMPEVSRLLALQFEVRGATGLVQEACIQLSCCRMRLNERVASYIKQCFRRLLELKASQTYINLPPCFHLKKTSFDLGLQTGWATFGWFCFDQGMAFGRVSEARLVSINWGDVRYKKESLAGPNPVFSRWDEPVTFNLQYESIENGKKVTKTLQADHRLLASGAAFPAWLKDKGSMDWDSWVGKPEVTKGDVMPVFKNFQARNIRLDHFGNFTRGNLVRSPDASKSLPEIVHAEPVKKKRLFGRQK